MGRNAVTLGLTPHQFSSSHDPLAVTLCTEEASASQQIQDKIDNLHI